MLASTQYLREVLHQACSTSFYFCIGVEIEFYAKNTTFKQLSDAVESIQKKLSHCQLTLEEEEGEGQYEIVFSPSKDILSYAGEVEMVRRELAAWAALNHAEFTLAARPFVDQPNSAMHVHVSAYNQQHKNIFISSYEGEESQHLLWSIAALLAAIPQSMPVFAPDESDYLRYQNPNRNTPSTISWGGENRTVALRIPAVGDQLQDKRIEHRLPSPNADIYEVVAIILEAVIKGISEQKLPTINKVYGNAWDDQYGHKLLPMSLNEAIHQHKPVL